MSRNENFITAIAALHGADDDDNLCAPILSALPVTGVGISTLGDPFGSETVCANGPDAVRLDEMQIDLGEGPCWEAMRTGQPVLEPNVQEATSETWPVALMAMREARLGAVFAFPMRVGTLRIGAVDLYSHYAGPIADDVLQDAIALTDAVARQVLHRALADDNDGHGETGREVSAYSRREVYQASGVLAAQTGVGGTDALLLLRAYAFTDGRAVRALASDVLAHTVDFTDRNDPAR